MTKALLLPPPLNGTADPTVARSTPGMIAMRRATSSYNAVVASGVAA
jgi:hypothetical protein